MFQDSNRKWHFLSNKGAKNFPPSNIPSCERMAKDAIQVVLGKDCVLAIKPKGK